MRLTVIALAALVLAAPAYAVTQALPPLITKPRWVQKPTGDDVNRVFPKEASAQGVGGTVVVGCNVLADGGLTGCAVLQAPDPDLGFGAAALELAPLFKMSPTTADGAPVAGGRVRFPLIFQPTAALPAEVPKYKFEIRDRQDRKIGTYRWVSKPSGEDVNKHFPDRPMREGVGGKTTLDCEITADGRMRRCWVVAESPHGYDFGDAGVALSKFFRLEVESKSVDSVDGGIVRIPMSFTTGG